jgi:hypothetical protein
MNSGVLRTGRAVAAAAVVIGLAVGCSGKSSDSASSGGARTAAPAPQTSVPTVPGESADCKAYTQLVEGQLSDLANSTAGGYQRESAAAAKLAGTLSDPKLKDGATKLAQYDQQSAAYAKNPTGKAPDSDLVNAASNAMSSCVPH